jgi:hypothetical protein
MAKRKAAKMGATAPATKETKPVRLDLSLADHARIEASASRYRLSKSAYVRMALFERLESDEREARRP